MKPNRKSMSNLNKAQLSAAQQNRAQPLYSITEVSWQHAQTALMQIRQQVFVIEQQVPETLEWDGLDEHAVHLQALDSQGNAIACARILPNGSIGRMAVLENWRGMGVGKALLQTALASCRKRGWLQVKLSAQTHAITFYQQAGFEVCSGIYLDAGIPHQDMRASLSN